MDPLEVIRDRKSVRAYSDREIGDEAVRAILEAGMSGPSCVNARDWAFLVSRDREIMNRMADANGPYAKPLREAKLGILVCGDLERAFPPAPDYWVVDGAIAAQNMILAAKAMGIGSVWLGTWPQMERVQALSEAFRLPKTVVPHSLIAFGYPAAPETAREARWEEDRVHYDKW